MKQSLKATLPLIQPLQPVKKLLETTSVCNKFIAHVDPENPVHLKDAIMTEKRTLILIGPEGDFSAKELDAASRNGFIKVSLGKSRLRTETAALAACFILNLRSED